MGIEPTRPAWKAGILPLNNTRLLIAYILYHNFGRLSRGSLKKEQILWTGLRGEDTVKKQTAQGWLSGVYPACCGREEKSEMKLPAEGYSPCRACSAFFRQHFGGFAGKPGQNGCIANGARNKECCAGVIRITEYTAGAAAAEAGNVMRLCGKYLTLGKNQGSRARINFDGTQDGRHYGSGQHTIR